MPSVLRRDSRMISHCLPSSLLFRSVLLLDDLTTTATNPSLLNYLLYTWKMFSKKKKVTLLTLYSFMSFFGDIIILIRMGIRLGKTEG